MSTGGSSDYSPSSPGRLARSQPEPKPTLLPPPRLGPVTAALPPGLEHVRTTDVFDEHHHPAGLLRAHRVADGVWARLVVHRGELTFVFEDDAEHPTVVAAEGSVVIPPGRLHHVELGRPVRFALEFLRERTADAPAAGRESTALDPS